ncbi:MAG: hypothetical protein AN485_07510 [Anabaena sp. MDT14b]|jgi:hypothetical protein|nr:MAG: hypothetical protein AN485_07510 [Anabaena sp. MDT14b]
MAQSKPPADTISGQLKLIAGGIGGGDDNCYGTRGFEDLRGMMPVIVRDEQEKIIAMGATENGKRPEKSDYSDVICIFSFQVSDIPRSKFYIIEIGSRGQAVFSRQKLEELNWNAVLTLAE